MNRSTFFILHPSAFILPKHDIRRLDITVDYSLIVGILQGFADGGDQLSDLKRRQAFPSQEVCQGDALDKVLDQVRKALVLPHLVNRNNGRMPQLGHAPGFAKKTVAVAALVVDGDDARHLDGHDPVQLGVPRLVDGTESPEPNTIDEFESSELALTWAGAPGNGWRACQVKTGTAGWAHHLVPGGVRLHGHITIRAHEMHGACHWEGISTRIVPLWEGI